MIIFFKEQLFKITQEIKQLYEQRAKCSIETVGSYDIMIERKKSEYQKIEQEIVEWNKDAGANILINPQNITMLIVRNKIPDAIRLLLNKGGDNITLNVILANFNHLEGQKHQRVISDEYYGLEHRKMTLSLLEILKKLE